MSPEDYAKAAAWIAQRDRKLGRVVERVGPCRIGEQGTIFGWGADAVFRCLVEIIVSQQLSSRAATTIFERVVACAPGGNLDVRSMKRIGDAELRAAGLSSSKIASVRDLCARIEAGQLPLDGWSDLDDAQVAARLTQVKGIGPWSSDMFLIFKLQRPDVLPVGDLGIRKAVHQLYALPELPDPARLHRIAAKWKPYRSVASWYLWRSLEKTAKAG